MACRGAFAWIVIAVWSACRGQVAAPSQPSATPERAAPPGVMGAVGRITPLDDAGKEMGSGTGFWIGASEVATNWHVIMHGHDPTLTMADGTRYRITRVMGA